MLHFPRRNQMKLITLTINCQPEQETNKPILRHTLEHGLPFERNGYGYPHVPFGSYNSYGPPGSYVERLRVADRIATNHGWIKEADLLRSTETGELLLCSPETNNNKALVLCRHPDRLEYDDITRLATITTIARGARFVKGWRTFWERQLLLLMSPGSRFVIRDPNQSPNANEDPEATGHIVFVWTGLRLRGLTMHELEVEAVRHAESDEPCGEYL
jgi:hypothetical protein